MELKIQTKQKKKVNKKPRYVVDVSFMCGDADGYNSDKVTFPESDIDNLKLFIMALERCNAAYPNGKGGDDGYESLPEYEAYFNEDGPNICMFEDELKEAGFKFEINHESYTGSYDYLKFIMDEERKKTFDFIDNMLKEKYNPGGYQCEHSTDQNYMTTSFDGYSVTFIDSDASKSNVEIEFTKEEQAHIKEAGEILN